DINQALEFIWYHHIHKNIEHTIRLDNIVLTAFIIDYFGINAALETLTTYVYQHNNSIDSLLMFIYDRSLCTTSLDEDDLNLLLYTVYKIDKLSLSGRNFHHVIKSHIDIPKLVNKADAKDRLYRFTEGMLDNITWDNIALIGGSVSLILNDYNFDDYLAADIDLFVWGDNRKVTINRLLKELRSQLDIVVFQRVRIIIV